MGHVLVVGSERTASGEVLVIDLAGGSERVLPVASVLESPELYFTAGS
jgi:hypothetical protein